AGAVRFAWGVPNDLQTFQSAKVVLIPSTAGAATLNIIVCAAQNSTAVNNNSVGPIAQPFTAIAHDLIQGEGGPLLASQVGTPRATHLAVVAFTTPTSGEHFVGLQFAYAPQLPTGVATLGANTFTGTQTAPAFSGSGNALTGVAKLGANTFSGNQTAPKFI